MLTNKATVGAFLSLIINLLCHVYDRLCCLRHLKQCHICIQNAIFLSERRLMTVVTNMHKTYVMSWLWRCYVSLMHTPSSKVLPKCLLTLMSPNLHDLLSSVMWGMMFMMFFIILWKYTCCRSLNDTQKNSKVVHMTFSFLKKIIIAFCEDQAEI